MALKINYNLKISYTFSTQSYTSILSNEQIVELNSSIEKTFVIQDAYCKINSVNGDKDSVEINLGIYKDETKQVLISNEIYSFVPSVDDTASNFIKQGYKYLKTLDEYIDAVDLLDEGQTA